MGQVLHGCATTTQVLRRSIQQSQRSLSALAREHNINRKTVAKWRARTSAEDAAMGPKARHSSVLSPEEEAVIVAFRKHTLLSLDDCLYTLQESIPHLTRSSLHRCLQRHGISRLPDLKAEKRKKKPFKDYPIGYVHIDIAEVATAEGKLYLFVAIDRTSKVAYAELHENAKRGTAADFLRAVIAIFPYYLHTVLTDNGIQFTCRERDRHSPVHAFDRVCRQHGIEHRLTKVGHPWTNGQVERMNRTLKEATVYRYHYKNHDELRTHLSAFLLAYNHAKRLKTLKGLTPHAYVCQKWQKEPTLFLRNPVHYTLGLYT